MGPVGSYATIIAGDNPWDCPHWVPLVLCQGPELKAVMSDDFSSPPKRPNKFPFTHTNFFFHQPAFPQRGTLVISIIESYCSLLNFQATPGCPLRPPGRLGSLLDYRHRPNQRADICLKLSREQIYDPKAKNSPEGEAALFICLLPQIS